MFQHGTNYRSDWQRDELNKPVCQDNSKDTVGSSRELDSLNGTVMKRLRETLSSTALTVTNTRFPKTQRDLCQGRRQAKRISLKLINKKTTNGSIKDSSLNTITEHTLASVDEPASGLSLYTVQHTHTNPLHAITNYWLRL